MRLDIHCHFFNFQTFLTAAAETNLKGRLQRTFPLSDAAANTAVSLMKTIIATGGGQSSLLRFLERMKIVSSFASNFVDIGCKPSISAVADAFFDKMAGNSASRGNIILPGSPTQAEEELVVTALMMDVVNDKSSPQDKDLFAVQYRDTVLQAIRYPGRVLPFVAVNPLHGDEALHYMEYALDSGECVGVKLYPSLGYDILDPMIDRIMGICAAHDAPIVMHCNDGGFCGPEPYDPDKCSPISWRDVVKNYEVRFDFAHFGEQHGAAPYNTLWRDEICKLMAQYPKFVFSDVSYQGGAIGGPAQKAAYQAWIQGVMGQGIGDNVLFGTDFFMLCMEAETAPYWDFFRSALGADFDRITTINPMRFLGFDLANASQIKTCRPRAKGSLERHAQYLRGKRSNPAYATGAAPAAWLTRLWAARP